MSRSASLAPGKVPQELLGRLLEARSPGAGEVVGPGVGLDGAVLDLGRGAGTSSGDGEGAHAAGEDRGDAGDGGEAPGTGRFLVAASDPITFTPEEIGWYAVHVNANDVACMGARPAWFLATLLLPEGTEEDDIREVFDQMERACSKVGASLVGGHTEVTPGLDRPVVAGTMLGTTDRWLSAAGARPGDALLLTKGAAIEGTAILARRARRELRGRVDERVLGRARDLLREPGLSVVRDARTALRAGGVRALHDPTEGGVAGGVRELCAASGTGARIDLGAIPVLEETRLVCEALGLDPLGLIASGALLLAAPDEEASVILRALRDEGIPARRIGVLTEAEEGLLGVDRDGRPSPFPHFDADEITRIL